MKRLSEELFFQYNSTSFQQGVNGIKFYIPDGYDPIPGDIIEMIISEGTTGGAVSYYAKLVVYKDDSGNIYTDALDGKLESAVNGFLRLLYASISEQDGKKIISLFANDGEEVLVESQRNLVNMIVHRSNAEIELYTL